MLHRVISEKIEHGLTAVCLSLVCTLLTSPATDEMCAWLEKDGNITDTAIRTLHRIVLDDELVNFCYSHFHFRFHFLFLDIISFHCLAVHFFLFGSLVFHFLVAVSLPVSLPVLFSLLHYISLLVSL